jgi:U3 small nucleolar RNA-associated protein 25
VFGVMECVDENETNKTKLKESDPFSQHFENVISDELANKLLDQQSEWKRQELNVEGVGSVMFSWPDDMIKPPELMLEQEDLHCVGVKKSLCNQLAAVNTKLAGVDITKGDQMTSVQRGIFACLNSYCDVYYPCRTYSRGEQLRVAYCVHMVNHILKTRSRVLAHNAKIKSRHDEIPDDYRDQGLTRPKVLVLVPFRESAVRIVNIMSELLSADHKFVAMKSRFESEFKKEDDPSMLGKKPADYEATFAGNIDDHFRIGLGISKKTLKLYTNFLKSDIILASPVGLRSLMEDGSKDGANSCDFLSSIELLIIDQADVLLMQNWNHVLDILDRINCQPKESHGTDFSRVRMWTLNGWCKLYRQTVVLSEFDLQPVRSTFLRYSLNYAGRLVVAVPQSGGIWVRIVVRMQHDLYRFTADSPVSVDDRRFEYFTTKLLPLISDSTMAQTLIFVSSSLDYIRLRNHMKRAEMSFVSLYEHDDAKTVQKARGAFVHGLRHIAIMTERFHFFRRYSQIRGIRHLVFYDLPARPHFYAEICNWIRDARRPHNEDTATCRVVYCKYDVLRLRAVVGDERLHEIMLSEKERYPLNPPALELRRR